MLRSWWRQALVIFLFLLIASCSGGGCSSGCSSCGIAPIAGGFDPTQTIPNSASVRVTKSGLEFLGTNVPNLASTLLGRSSTGNSGVIDFNIPSAGPVSLAGQNLYICQNPDSSASPEQCVAEINIGGAQLTINAVTPDAITLSGTIPVRIQDIVVTGSVIILGNIRIDLGVGSNLSCNTSTGGVSANAGFTPFPLTVTLPLVAETIPPRIGYTKIDAANATANITITSSDIVACSDDTGVLGDIVNGLLGALTGTIASSVGSQINGVVINEIQTQLCTKANAALNPPCPNGTEPAGDGGAPLLPDGGVPSTEPNCVYDTQPTSCLPTELGLEGNINLGSLLSSISPGTTGAVNFVIAANGNMIAAPNAAADSNGNTPNGITLGMLGGANAAPPSDCIPPAANPAPTGLTIPTIMYGDSVTGYGGSADGGADGGGPDLGIAVNGAFLNYFLGSAYNSGMLCLGVTTEKFQQLNTGLVSLIIPSLKTLTFEEKGAAIAVTTRPQNPPVVTLGGGTNVNTDPLLSVALKSFILDFYVWSEDRYVRAFSFTGDLTIPVNIQSTSAGIQPVLGTLVIANPAVTNNVLITDDAATVAMSLSGVLGSIVGQLVGSGIGPINLAGALSSLGLTFTIPPGGIQTINETSDAGLSEAYLGLFGNFGLPGSAIPQIDTQAKLVGKTVHADAMKLGTMTPELAPSISVHFSSPADDGKTPIEYSWQLDQGTFSAWSRAEDVTIRDPMLWMQAKHTLQVVARVAGVVESQDPTPAIVPFSIDVLPPTVQAQKQDTGAWALSAWDVVSPQSALVARLRGTDANGKVGEWTEWQPLSSLVADSSFASVDLQVRDEEGNVGGVTPELIRGGPDPTLPASGGCSSGCTAAPSSNASGPALALGIAGVLGLAARRRRRNGALLALGSVVSFAATNQGCSCGGPGTTTGTEPTGDASTPPAMDGGQTIMPTPDGAPPPKLCGPGCNQQCDPALPQGLVGAYTSIAEASDGTIWVAGYNDAAFNSNTMADTLYGDLVVGKYNTTTSEVDWTTVDGLPPPLGEDVCPPADPTGWRGGIEDSGPDVGLWTSIVLDANGHPMVSYYDSTHQALKFAYSPDGTTWSNYAVFQTAAIDAGRYSKIVLINGNPVIAYLDIETGTNGYSRTKVSLAHATVANPTSASDWTIEDALVDETSPCRPQDCTSGQACVTSTMVCTAESSGCDAGCSSGQACVNVSNVPTCEAIAQVSDIHPYPDAVGDYINISAVQNGIGLLVYDRIHGNLLGLTNASGSWQVTILDGETGSRANGTAVDTGDDGVGASLFVATNGDWHVSYVDGITETLKYLYVPGGTLSNSLTPQIVDDGSKVDGAAFADGIHIVGDDSNVRQNADGSVTITYMDATAGTLRLATGASSPGAWTLHAVSQPNRFAGFFPHFVPGNSTVENWWRWADQTTTAISGNVAFVTP